MAAENAITATDSDKVLAELAELRRWSGAPREFWPHFLASVGKLAHARKVSLLFKDASEPPRWQSIQEWSSNTGSTRFLSQFTMQLSEIAERCAAGNEQIFPQERMQARGPGQWVIAARLQFHRPDGSYVIACLLPEETESSAREALVRLNLIADVPASYQVNQLSRIAKADVEKFAIALDLMVTVNTEKKFLAAALALCNGLATRLACERVSLAAGRLCPPQSHQPH